MRTTRDRLKAGCIAFGDHGGLRRYARLVSCPGQDLNTLLQVVSGVVECVEFWMLWATKKAGLLLPFSALSAFL